MIGGLNHLSFDIPDWVPLLGGKKFGINIPTIGKIPYLASGGVLSQGSAVVGEAGPELLTMMGTKAVVQPLTSSTTTNTNLGWRQYRRIWSAWTRCKRAGGHYHGRNAICHHAKGGRLGLINWFIFDGKKQP